MLAIFGAVEAAVVVIAWVLAYCLYHLSRHLNLMQHAAVPFAKFVPSMVLSLILMLLVFSHSALYLRKRTKKLPKEIWDVFRAVLITWGLTYVITTLMSQAKVSRMMMLSVLAVWSILAILNRLAVRKTLRWFRRRGWNQRTAAIIGTDRLAQKLCHTLRHHLWTGISPQYFLGDHPRDHKLLGLDVTGSMDTIAETISQSPVDMVFVALPNRHHDQIAKVLDRLATLNVDIQVVPDLLSFYFLKHNVSQLEDISIITLTHSPQHGWNKLIKRAFDIVVSALAVVIVAIPMMLIALIVKFSSRGPVFYRQVRSSLGGQPFNIIKFRTMKENSEAKTGAVWATRNDSRVTRVGRFLRRTSLDELPQLFNVLAGHMSLVGPRPERPELIERFRHQVPRYMLRHQVKAGLAGWAQVHGLRGQTSLRKRVQYDLYYVTNWTLGLDLRILFMSLFRGFTHPNAY